MKKFYLALLLFGTSFMLCGCMGPSVRQYGEMEIVMGPSIVIILLIITSVIFKIIGNNSLDFGKRMKLQFLILFILSLILSSVVSATHISSYLNPLYSLLEGFFYDNLAVILEIPTLLFLVSLAIIIIPIRHLFYLPITVLVSFNLFALLAIISNDEKFHAMMWLTEIWEVSLSLFVILILIVIYKIKKFKKTNQV